MLAADAPAAGLPPLAPTSARARPPTPRPSAAWPAPSSPAPLPTQPARRSPAHGPDRRPVPPPTGHGPQTALPHAPDAELASSAPWTAADPSGPPRARPPG